MTQTAVPFWGMRVTPTQQNGVGCAGTQASSWECRGEGYIHNQIIFHSPTAGYHSSPRARVLGVSSDVPAQRYGYPRAV